MKRLYIIFVLINITIISLMFAFFIALVNLPTEQVNIVNDTPVTTLPNEEEKLSAKASENVVTTKDSNKYVSIEVCNSSSVKTYMDYRMITSKSSKQYRYIQEHITVTDGFLWEDEYIGVALGSYFGEIGSKYIFTLDTGIELKVVKVEAKADKHTNNGCEQRWDKSVIEFVIDSRAFKKEANGYVKNGNFNNDEAFRGKIVKVERVVE